MADDPLPTNDISDPVEAGATKEDAETTAARRELKQTSISEKAGHNSLSLNDKSASDDDTPQGMQSPRSPSRRMSPPVSFVMSSSTEDVLKDQISSPKKKRAHDEYDENKDVTEAPLDPATAATDAATTTTITSVTLSRTDRSEPEKKRPRDRQASASAVRSGKEEVEPLSASASPRSSMEVTMTTVTTTTTTTTDADSAKPKEQSQSSTSAFANSGFSKLASSSASPFGSFGGAGKPSLFGSASSGGGSFTSVLGGSTSTATAPAAPRLSFGSAASSSPFASINGATGGGSLFKSSPFGSAFGGSALSGSRLSTFGKPGEALKSDKPARPFGAPDSDAEDDDGPSTGDEGGDEEKGENAGSDEDKEKEEAKAADEEKKVKLRKVEVDDGEGGEVTLSSQRAKMFVMEKGVGWKERGAGMLKVNVPEATVDVDDNGVSNVSSFDASVLDDSEGHAKNVRLIMRQDHTHKVILNTVVLPAMKFQVTNKLKAATVLFTAFEGKDPIQVQMKSVAIERRTIIESFKDSFSFAYVLFGRPEDIMPPKTAVTIGAKGIPGKRKSPPVNEEASPSPSLNKEDDETAANTLSSQKRKRTAKPKACPSESKEPETPVIIPPYFLSLIQTHSALNTVFTFLSARKSVITTFETLNPAVEQHLKSRPLLVEDVAAIKALRPDGIRFEYVDLDSLTLDARLGEKDELFRTGGGGGSAALPGVEGLDLPPDHAATQEEVLFFEFIDEELKRSTAGNKPKPADGKSGRRKLKEVKMPSFSLEQMKNLIEKRDKKFKSAVEQYVSNCDAIDPEVLVLQEREHYIPAIKSATSPSESQQPTLPPGLQREDTLPSSIPKERKSITEIVQELKQLPWYTGQIVPDGHRGFEPQEAVYGDLEFLLSQDLVNALFNVRGITKFYAHQAKAINALNEGYNVVVSTSTSSGKSLIYQLPILCALEKERGSRGLFIFPTKALAQDQVRGLRGLLEFMPGMEGVRVETFDGDTHWQERNEIRDEASVIFTNPDMLHLSILPKEENWRSFLQNLKYVVVDELHYYNGLFGSHMAFIMRRLRRVCAAVGNSHIKFISCSATVGNPEEHFKTIFGNELDVKLVDFDGSPSGRKEFLCWNTPYRDPGDPSSGRGNACYECSRLFCQLILRGVRVIAFCRVRAQCEKLVSGVKQELEKLGRAEVINRVMGYRGGYTAQDRRRIESEMFEGKLLGIIATSALELGVDIGTLDCVLTWGFPYTIANLRQQSGRAGRRNKDSLSILVGDSFATDQHYMDNPDELFTKPNAQLQVDLNNTLVKEGHIQCAAYEMPIRPETDSKYFGSDLVDLCSDRLIKDPQTNFYHTHDRFRPQPSKFVSIRDIEDDHFAIIDITKNRNTVLEELEASRATFTLYDGAIFLHQGEAYLVRDFNPDRQIARVEKAKVNYTTKQRDYTDVDPVETELVKRISDSSPCHAYYGPIKITQVVFGFFKLDARNPTRILDAVSVSNPPVVRYSKGMWLDIPKPCLDLLTSHHIHVAGSIHAAQHAVMSLIPNFVISLPGDVRTECKNALKEYATHETSRKRPARLTFYDSKGGKNGSGINTKAFEFVDSLLAQALERIERCKCVGKVEGCPECCVSEFCKEGNEVMSKAGGKVVLMSLLGREIDEGRDVPDGPEVREGKGGRDGREGEREMK
ncbi:hypothetical protein QBC43DRAFT_378211 [Cladorrhinum sp. PSN259]|nr:hypothetical protein QBC43DRAFT_378211 [Cladorrhinum sp. PSN259]